MRKKEKILTNRKIEYLFNKTLKSLSRYLPDTKIELNLKRIEKGFYEVRIQSVRSEFYATAFGRDPNFSRALKKAKNRFLRIFFNFKGRGLQERRSHRRPEPIFEEAS